MYSFFRPCSSFQITFGALEIAPAVCYDMRSSNYFVCTFRLCYFVLTIPLVISIMTARINSRLSKLALVSSPWGQERDEVVLDYDRAEQTYRGTSWWRFAFPRAHTFLAFEVSTDNKAIKTTKQNGLGTTLAVLSESEPLDKEFLLGWPTSCMFYSGMKKRKWPESTQQP